MRMYRHIQGPTAAFSGHGTRQAWEFDDPAPASDSPFFQHIIESSPTPILVIEAGTADQRVVYANPAFEHMLGCRRDDLIGRDWRLFLSVYGPAERARALQGSLGTDFTPQETLAAIGKDGTLLYFEARFSPVWDGAGTIAQHVAVLHDVTSEHRQRETLKYRACYDPLTGLANRYLLRDRFEHAAAQAQRRGTGYILTLLDLNRFKQVNDRFGHAAGDEVLTYLSSRLMDLVRGEDTVARLGGDEFVLLLMDADPQSTDLILHRLGEALAAFGPAGRDPLGLSCTVGVALFPDDGTTLEALLAVADKRLYAAKS